ncbi:MAG: hypothetical protein V1871_07060 [Planctomycetota bacterium]
MIKKMINRIMVVLFLVAFVIIFNYGGCGGGGGGGSSGSSAPPATTTPSVTTNPATDITQTTATLNGTVNPNGVTSNVCFQFGTTTAYDSTTASQNIGSGTNSVTVTATITGLTSNTTYNFRIKVTTGSGGTGIVYNGANLTFTTGIPPTCTTGPATDVNSNSAQLNGTVNPNGFDTTAYLNYGLTTSYTVTTTSQAIGSGTADVAITVTAGSLTSNTEYNFRVVGTNSFGITYGNNLTFTIGAPLGSAPTCTTDPADNINTNSAGLNGTVNPNGTATTAYFNYGLTTSYTVTTTSQTLGSGVINLAVSATAGSLTQNTLYNFRVIGINSAGTTSGNNRTFTTTALLLPICTTNAAANIASTSATLNGTVNPNGLNVTSCYFQYGTTESYGSQQNVSTLPGSGTSPISVTASVSSLSISTTYNFRVVATNAGGTTNGNNLTLTTLAPSTCTTNAADNITANSARLNGTVNPNGLNVTSCYFDYGTSQSYGSTANVSSLPGSGTSPISVTANVSSLSISTTYNFRVVATNSGGTTNGNNLTFSTLAPPTCTTNAAINKGSTSATLNGTVNPNGLDVTSCYFDYGTTQSYGSQQNVSTLPGSGTSPISVTANVSSLSISTTYNFRVVATNAGGTTNGNNLTFNTLDDYCWVVNQGTGNVTRIVKSTSAKINITVGTSPYGVAVDETYCWVSNSSSNTVTRITKSTGVVYDTISGVSSPYGVAVDDIYCWVANYISAGTVTRIQKSNPAITTTITVGTYPYGVAVDDTYCWVTNQGSDNVTRILKSTLATTNIAVGDQPSGVAVDETYCWVANYGTASTIVTRIQKSNPVISTTITVGTRPWGIAVDETYCWVSNYGSANVTRILKTDSSPTNITVGSVPFSLGDMTGYAYNNYSRVP